MSLRILTSAGIGALLFFGAVFLAYSYAVNNTDLAARLKRKGFYRCPQYRHKDFIFGSDYPKAAANAVVSGLPVKWQCDQFATYGKTFEVMVWGRRMFLTCDAINIQSLMTAHGAAAGVGPSREGLLAWLGPGTFTVDGEPWKRSRELLKPVFKKTALSDLSRLEKHVKRLFTQLEMEGLEVDLQANLIRMFFDFLMDLLIGQDAHTLSKDLAKIDPKFFLTACDGSQVQVMRSRQPWLVRWWKGWTKTWGEPLQVTQEFIARYVHSAVLDFETTTGGPIQRSPAFLDELIRQAGSEDQAYIRDQILNVFMPGRDSTGAMMSHIMFHLARNPAAYGKVRAEVLAAGFGRTEAQTSYEAIKNLPYLNAIVNESLRLGGPLNGRAGRDIMSDIVLPRGGGLEGDQPLLIPKGSVVSVEIRALQRDPAVWGSDADVFRPERWIETSRAPERLAFQYLPFGGGRRICPANALVVSELAYILASFAARYRELQNRDPEQTLFETGSIVLKIRNGVLVRLVK